MFAFLKGHVHPIAIMPPVPTAAGNGQKIEDIERLLNDAEKLILNQNIRINWYLCIKEHRCQLIIHILVETIPSFIIVLQILEETQ